MCARYAFRKVSVVLEDLGAAPLPNLEPRHNILPRESIPIIIQSDGKPVVQMVRWGLIPSWAKDSSVGDRAINARAETIREKPTFRSAFPKRRCLIPATGFYEWRGDKGAKEPMLIHPKEREGFAMAGLFEDWDGEGGIRSATIITVTANEVVSAVHDRMPALLPPDLWRDWINPQTPAEIAEAWLAPDSFYDLLLTPHPREDLLPTKPAPGQDRLF